MIKKAFQIVISVLLLSLVLEGCTSAGHSTRERLIVPQIVQAPRSTPSVLKLYEGQFIDALESHGFLVGSTEDPEALELVFIFDGNPFNMKVVAELRRGSVAVLTASANNAGWGTAISRGGAVADLAGSALSEFEKELNILLQNVSIRTDHSSNANTSKTNDNGSSSSNKEIVESIGSSLSCTDSLNLLRKSKESETWIVGCGGDKSLEVRCFDGDCYIKQ